MGREAFLKPNTYRLRFKGNEEVDSMSALSLD